MTDDPRAQSVLPDSIAGALDEYGYAACSGAADTASKRVALTRAIADALEAQAAEIARLKLSQSEMYGSGKRLEGELRQRAQDAEAALAASRAENAALVKRVTAAIEYIDDLGNMGPHLEGDRKRVLKALRAGQQKGER